MKNAVFALTEAVRLARLEIACYRDNDCRGTPEWTVNRLAELLGDKSVDDAMAVLAPDAESPFIILARWSMLRTIAPEAIDDSIVEHFVAELTGSLADARARRDAAKKILEDSGDPSVQRKIDKQARGNSFRLVAQELLDKMQREGRAPQTLIKMRWLWELLMRSSANVRLPKSPRPGPA